MLNIELEQTYFLNHVKSLGVLQVEWDQNGEITSIQRETECCFRFDQIVILWDTWLKAKTTGIVLHESDIETAITVEGTAVKNILLHVEQAIIQKALIFSKGNQRLAADQIGMSRTKLRSLVHGKKSHSGGRLAA